MIAPAAIRNIAAPNVMPRSLPGPRGGANGQFRGLAQPVGQPARVAYRVGLPVVVEVGEDLDPRSPGGDPPLPLLELALGVVAVAPTTPVVEPDVGPIGGDLAGFELAPGVVGDDEGGVVLAELVVDVGHEPARVPELETVPTRRHRSEGGSKPLVVAVEGLGELPEDRPELARLAQRRDRVEEPAEAPLRLGQPLDVGDIATHLHRERESLRRALGPAADRALARQPVEGGVDLDRVEDLGVALEPAPLRQALRIEDP